MISDVCGSEVKGRSPLNDFLDDRLEKLLGVLIDSNLNFEKHVSNICKKAANKLFALSRMSTYLGTDKLRLLMGAFVTSLFQYCPLVWMFHSRKIFCYGGLFAHGGLLLLLELGEDVF